MLSFYRARQGNDTAALYRSWVSHRIGDIETSREPGCVCSTGNREKDQCGSRANAPVRAILCYAG